MQFCTIVAANYLSQALVLAGSLRQHHPESGELVVLLVDAEPAEIDTSDLDGVQLVSTSELVGMDRADFEAMRTFYDVTELSTSLKPALLSHLRERDDVVVYLDPDIALFQPLAGLEALAREHGIVLTPHVTQPMPRDGRTIDERTIMRAGIFNLGFIAVGPGTEPFLEWWWTRLRTDALNDPSEGLFTDQRWIDFVPALFTYTVVRDLGWNVAYWNLHERPLARGEDGSITVGGRPLVFFHFSGYDSASPHIMSKHQGPTPRVLVSSSPVLVDLLAWYGEELERHRHAENRTAAYRWGAIDGVPLPELIRRLYRRTFLGQEFGEVPGPDAFTDTEAFITWLNHPVARSKTARLTRLQLAYWAMRVDLQWNFPHPTSTDLDRLASWFDEHADDHVKRTIGAWTRCADEPEPVPPRPPSPGIVVAGYLNAELGVGEAGRLMLTAAGATGLPVGSIGYHRTLSRQQIDLRRPDGGDLDADLAVICVNADQTPNFFADAGDRVPARAVRVGMWFWEVPEFPAAYHGAFKLVDEVWVATRFVADAVAPHTTKAVRVVPLPVVPDAPTALTRADIGLPEDAYVFGFTCDARSVMARKNPRATLRAYLDAFPASDDTHLVVKVMNGQVDSLAVEELRWLSRERPDVTVVDDVWDVSAMKALTQHLDCYVSLHRSEGYGLGLAQAMVQGKPVVATGWSGNMEFMTPTTAFLVPHLLVHVGDAPPYPPTARWAEPDHDAAVDLLRSLRARPGTGVAVGEVARADLLRRFSIAGAGAWFRDRAIEASMQVAACQAEELVPAGHNGSVRP